MHDGGKDIDQRFEEFRQVFRADRAKDYKWFFARLEKLLRNFLPYFYRATTEGSAAMVHADSVLRRCEELLSDGIQAKELGNQRQFGTAMRDLNLGPSVPRRCPRDADGKRKLKGRFWSFENLVFAHELHRLLGVAGGHGVQPPTTISEPSGQTPYHYYKLLIGIRNSEPVSTIKQTEELPVITKLPIQDTDRPRAPTRAEIAEDYRRFTEEEQSLVLEAEPPSLPHSLVDVTDNIITPSHAGWSRERFLKDQIIGDLLLIRRDAAYTKTLGPHPFDPVFMIDLARLLIEQSSARPALYNPDHYCLELQNNPDKGGYSQFSDPFLKRLQQDNPVVDESYIIKMEDMPCKVISRFVAWTFNPQYEWKITRGKFAERLGEDDVIAHHRCRNRKCVNPNHLLPIVWREHRKLHQLCGDEHELAEEVEEMWPEV
jgi:hypothetical protein